MTPYPLAWPEMMPRTKSKAQSRFKTSLAGAMKNVREEIARFATDSGKKLESVVISSNVTLDNNQPADTGVALWFVWDGLHVAIAIDRYPRVEHNLQAIFHVLEARRTEMRHGGLNIVRATMRGFTALPAPAGKRAWRDVFKFGGRATTVTAQIVNDRYRELAKESHPDAGGSVEAMAELNAAREEALAELGE